MAQIAVDVDVLTGVARTLRGVGDELGAAGRELVGVTSDVTGHPGLAASLEQFTDHWQRGLTTLGRSASVAGEQLDEALRAYGSVEAGIARAAG